MGSLTVPPTFWTPKPTRQIRSWPTRSRWHIGALPAASTALAERCPVAIAGHDWSKAETLAEQALSMVQAGQLDDYLMSPLVYTVAARTDRGAAGKLDTTRGRLRGASTLTTAELRLLPLLPTHLSFKEIGDRLDVSKHTVKTRAVSIYPQARRFLAQRGDQPATGDWPARGVGLA